MDIDVVVVYRTDATYRIYSIDKYYLGISKITKGLSVSRSELIFSRLRDVCSHGKHALGCRCSLARFRKHKQATMLAARRLAQLGE
jgi:hypothetical protein